MLPDVLSFLRSREFLEKIKEAHQLSEEKGIEVGFFVYYSFRKDEITMSEIELGKEDSISHYPSVKEQVIVRFHTHVPAEEYTPDSVPSDPDFFHFARTLYQNRLLAKRDKWWCNAILALGVPLFGEVSLWQSEDPESVLRILRRKKFLFIPPDSIWRKMISFFKRGKSEDLSFFTDEPYIFYVGGSGVARSFNLNQALSKPELVELPYPHRCWLPGNR